MAAALPVIMVVGTVISAIGAIQQGNAQKTAADYNATINQQNVTIASEQAQQQAKQQDIVNRQRLGTLIATQGANGGELSGSVLDVIGMTAAQSELQKQQALYEGQVNARGYANTATGQKYIGDQEKRAGYMSAAGKLAVGAAGYNKMTSTLTPDANPSGGGSSGGVGLTATG